MAEDEDEVRPLRRPRRRWGMWALAFLTLALVAVLTSGNGYTIVSAFVVLGSIVCAAYCSYRGVKEFTWLPR